jgi:hypothetical protein
MYVSCQLSGVASVVSAGVAHFLFTKQTSAISILLLLRKYCVLHLTETKDKRVRIFGTDRNSDVSSNTLRACKNFDEAQWSPYVFSRTASANPTAGVWGYNCIWLPQSVGQTDRQPCLWRDFFFNAVFFIHSVLLYLLPSYHLFLYNTQHKRLCPCWFRISKLGRRPTADPRLRPLGNWNQHLLVLHSEILRSAHTVYLCVLCGSENKQRLCHYTALTDWFL